MGREDANMPDEDLIDDFYRCREESFETLYRRYYPMLVAYFRRFGLYEDAEDLAEETFLKIVRSKDTGNGRFDPRRGNSFKAWLFVIAINVALDHRRRHRVQVVQECDEEDGSSIFEEIPSGEPTPQEILAAEEFSAPVLDCLQKLTPREREVLLMADVVGLTLPEIASALGISYGRAANALSAGRRKMRVCLQQKGYRFIKQGSAIELGARIVLVFSEENEMLIYISEPPQEDLSEEGEK